MPQNPLSRPQELRLIAYALDHLLAHTNGNGHKRPYTRRAPEPEPTDQERAVADKIDRAWTRKRTGKRGPNTGAHVSGIRARRQKSAAVLAKYSTDDPRPSTIAGVQIGPYVRRGYLKKKGDGYIRTAKPYEP